MELTENQKSRLANINYVVGSVALLGSIGGVIYSHKTGGGFWRGVGYWILGGLALSLPAKVISLPFSNKILKEGDASNSKTSNDLNENKKLTWIQFNDIIVEALEAEKRSGVKNQFAQLVKDQDLKTKLSKRFQDSVTFDEYESLKNFYKKFDKSMIDTFGKISSGQKALVQKGTAKIFY